MLDRLRLLLYPFSLLFGAGVWLRNQAFDRGWLSSESYPIPIISVGNLAVGGAGKSPMVEYLIRLFGGKKIGVLSRGYGRSSKGFRWVAADDEPELAGDEPLQIKRKFPEVRLAVSEDRRAALARMGDLDLVLLDDAFQHRQVKPGFNILVMDYPSARQPVILLPAGNFREPLSSRHRADCLVITKTPEISEEEKADIRRKLQTDRLPVFFSSLAYGSLKALFGEPDENMDLIPGAEIFLLTGIANPAPLLHHLARQQLRVRHHAYPDHQPFSSKNIRKLAADYRSSGAAEKLILTTEKDAQRLKKPHFEELLAGLPVYYLPVETVFDPADKDAFENLIKHYVAEHPSNHRIH